MNTTTKSKKSKVERLTEAKRYEELKSFVGICFSCLEEYDFKEVCNLTGLSLTTIMRLFNGQFTLAMRFGTIQALGIAAGLRLEMTEYRVRVALAA